MTGKDIISGMLLAVFALSGCSVDRSGEERPYPGNFDGAPRFVIQGKVTNSEALAIEGIHVAVYGVRTENEKDLKGYNYALTDTAGAYTMIRYRGREMPSVITVVATDPEGVFNAKDGDFEVRYDSVGNGFVTADFVLKAQ